MSEEEFFSRLLNKIDKEFGYDVASTLELMFMTKEQKVEQLENIRKEIKECIETDSIEINTKEYGNLTVINSDDLLNILNKGE